jgi:hypothetical protein
MSLDMFERTLLTELRQHVAARSAPAAMTHGHPRRRWTLGLAGAGLVGGGAAAIILSVGAAHPAPAYAVESQPDGDVVVTVYDLSDAAGLEGALEAKGVHAEISYVAGFVQDDGESPSSGTPDACTIALAKIDDGLRFTLAAAEVDAGATLHIVTSGSSATDMGSPVAVSWSGGGC